MDINLELTGYYRAEFEKAKADQKWVGALQITTVLFSAAASLVPNQTLVYAVSILAVIGTILWNYKSSQSSSKKANAERARRILMLIGGLNYQPSDKQIRDIESSFTASKADAQKWNDPNYFDASDPVGPIRLAKMMKQSCFWSKELYKQTAQETWFKVASSIIFIIVVEAFALSQTVGRNINTIIIQVLVGTLTLFATRDLISKAMCCDDAAKSLDQLEERLGWMITSNNSMPDVLCLFGDYNSVVECSPIISTAIYKKHTPRLEKIWAAYNSKKTNP